MTDQPEQHPDGATETKQSRWDRMRPRSRLSQIALVAVVAAASVFVAGAIFATGFALGSDGGEHHGHGGDGEHSWQADQPEGADSEHG